MDTGAERAAERVSARLLEARRVYLAALLTAVDFLAAQAEHDPVARELADVEFGSLEWVDWWNNRRLLEPIGMIPPAEAEALFYSQRELVEETGTQGNESL